LKTSLSVEGRKDMTPKVTKWETELWSYVSSGDGSHCPLYSCCQDRLRGASCPDDNKLLFEQISRIKKYYPSNYYRFIKGAPDFMKYMENWSPCRVFQLVEKLAQKYVKKGGVSSPPVPTKLISLADKDTPVEVRSLPLKNYHGAIWRLKDKWVIQLRAKDKPCMKRFTLFHEAFHILAHCQATPVFSRPGKEDAYFNELLADRFAGCVLMPEDWVVEKWREVDNIGRMAEIFDVSESQIWYRLKLLHLI